MYFLVLLSALLVCVAGVPLNTTKPTQNGRIAGGTWAYIEDHPHQVALLQYGSLFCSGSIISPTCVVTAAHCVIGRSAGSITIRAGSTYFEFGGSTHYVSGGFYHSNFDVAVLRVFPPFSYSNSVQNIELQNYEVSSGTNVVVTGWGSTWSNGSPSYSLREVIVQIQDYYTCRDHANQYITDTMICTGYPYTSNGPCNGDGGGPLTTLYCPRRLVGIVSSEQWDCGNTPYPSVYTKVSAVRDWIIQLCNAGAIPIGITKADPIP